MKEQNEQKLLLILNGAISFYESECLEIPSILKKEERPDLFDAYDTIGTALYWMKEELEK